MLYIENYMNISKHVPPTVKILLIIISLNINTLTSNIKIPLLLTN